MVQNRRTWGENSDILEIEKEANLMRHTAYIKTALGPIEISEVDGFITELFFIKDTLKIPEEQKTPLLEKAEKQIKEYLDGTKFRMEKREATSRLRK